MLIDKKLRPRIDSAYLSKKKSNNKNKNYDFRFPFIISSLKDSTSLFFQKFCLKNDLPLNYYPIESIIKNEITLNDFINNIPKVKSIYLRPPILITTKEVNLWSILHANLLFSNPTFVLQPRISFLNHSKPLQINASIKKHQNELVKPIFTYVRNFCIKERSDDFIVKGVSDTRTEVVLSNDKRLNWLSDDIVTHPYLLQRAIKGNNYRVHVVNNQVFGTKISLSKTIDYRYSDEDIMLSPINVPDAVRRFCLDVTKSEKLSFSGIDFIINDNVWYCLEINPNPGYHSYDTKDNDISYELYNLLNKNCIQSNRRLTTKQ